MVINKNILKQQNQLAIFCRFHHLSCDTFLELSSLVEQGCESTRLFLELKDRDLAIFVKKKSDTWQLCLQILEDIYQLGGEVLFPGHNDYPESFFNLHRPPVFLSYWGRPVWKVKKGLAVVGSRKASNVSLTWMEQQLGDFLSGHEYMVISGGAIGVDQKAHGVALKCKKPTVVFLPSGFRELYPQNLLDWVSPVLNGGGALISEYFPHTGVRRLHFHERNRMIAALGEGMLVVEASARSGTMISARYAMELNKPLGVIPGHPCWSSFRGSLELITAGAYVVKDDLDLKILFSGKI